jgi:hypothetical protein
MDHGGLELHGAFRGMGLGALTSELFFHVISCFSVFEFEESFASHWLWNIVGVLWGPQCLSSSG